VFYLRSKKIYEVQYDRRQRMRELCEDRHFITPQKIVRVSALLSIKIRRTSPLSTTFGGLKIKNYFDPNGNVLLLSTTTILELFPKPSKTFVLVVVLLVLVVVA
jgi:hypothetical protein